MLNIIQFNSNYTHSLNDCVYAFLFYPQSIFHLPHQLPWNISLIACKIMWLKWFYCESKMTTPQGSVIVVFELLYHRHLWVLYRSWATNVCWQYCFIYAAETPTIAAAKLTVCLNKVASCLDTSCKTLNVKKKTTYVCLNQKLLTYRLFQSEDKLWWRRHRNFSIIRLWAKISKTCKKLVRMV